MASICPPSHHQPSSLREAGVVATAGRSTRGNTWVKLVPDCAERLAELACFRWGQLYDEPSATFERYPHDNAASLLGDLHRAIPGPRLHRGHPAPLFHIEVSCRYGL